MTPRRVGVLILALVLAVALALGMWGERTPRLSDDEYIAIALSQPEVFHPTPGGGTTVTSTRVEHGATFVAVEVTLPGSASDHQCSHFQEARPHAPDRIDQRSDPRTHASDEVLIEDEKRLNRTDHAMLVLNGEIPSVVSG